MARYIDMDKLAEMLRAKSNTMIEGKETFLYVSKWLDLLPSVEAVRVVRCKDCYCWKDTSCDTVTEIHWGECRKPLGDYRYCETSEHDFCSYGEERSGDNHK